MTLAIDGVDITGYIKYQGLKWKRSDIDSTKAGRTLDGKMHRGRIATKIRLDVECRPLTTAEASVVLQAILPQWVTVVYTDPMAGTTATKTMYSNNNPAAYCQRYADGTELWDGITFPLIEQ